MSDAALAEAEKEVTGEVEESEEVSPEILAKAKEMGWRPKEEWVGDDSNWIEDPEKFIERQERLKDRADGIAKAENERLTKQIEEQSKRLAELTKTIEDFKGYREKADKKAYERALKDLKAEQRKAVEEGDTEAFDRVEQQIGDLEKETEPPKSDTKPEDDPVFRAWKADNDWYGKDVAATVYANQAAEVIGPGGLVGRAFFDAVTEAVKERYPEKFENPNRRKAAAVEGAGGGAPKKEKAESYANLPQEAKEACDRFVKEGLMTREEYVEDYPWE